MNVNLDTQSLEHCLKSVRHLGKTEYMNICDGSINIVSWGMVDWVLTLFLGGILFLFVAFLIFATYVMFTYH